MRTAPSAGCTIQIMQVPEDILAELHAIDQWATIPLSQLTNNDDFMAVAMELMNHAQYLLFVGISLAPTQMQAENGVTRRRAIVLGHLVRIHKLYNALRYHTANKERNICAIFDRLLIETVFRAEYLMKARTNSFRSFVLTSYRPEKQMLDDLRQKSSLRPFEPIERRMMASIKHCLRQDRVSVEELKANKNWDLDGKSFRQILSDLGCERGYAYGFGIGSHWIHGDWFDLRRHHLKRTDGRYRPRWDDDVPDPRGVCPSTILCLSLKFAKSRKGSHHESRRIHGVNALCRENGIQTCGTVADAVAFQALP